MAAAGLVGYAGYEAAQMEDAVFQLIYHSGLENNEANKTRFRTIIQNAMKETGFGLHDISESAKQEIRMFQGTPGGGLDVLPEMLKAAAIEARLKGNSPEESMKALIGLAHMTKQYGSEDIKKLAPAFAFLSTANPGSLSSIERAAGYAVPLLQSGLEIDPMQSLLLGTALTRAGATSTKSGTWLREMALRAMPGTSMMSKTAFKKHEEALKAFGLVDDNDKPTWFTNGKPDIFKMLNIAGERATSIPLEKRAGYERQLFGAQWRRLRVARRSGGPRPDPVAVEGDELTGVQEPLWLVPVVLFAGDGAERPHRDAGLQRHHAGSRRHHPASGQPRTEGFQKHHHSNPEHHPAAGKSCNRRQRDHGFDG
jgi:hypothetical protein